MKKRILSILLALVFMLSLFPSSVLAAGDRNEVERSIAQESISAAPAEESKAEPEKKDKTYVIDPDALPVDLDLEQTIFDSIGSTIVAVTGKSLPKDARLEVTPYAGPDSDQYIRAIRDQYKVDLSNEQILDVKILDGEKHWEPTGGESVMLYFINEDYGSGTRVWHFADKGDRGVASELQTIGDDGYIGCYTTGFSYYVVANATPIDRSGAKGGEPTRAVGEFYTVNFYVGTETDPVKTINIQKGETIGKNNMPSDPTKDGNRFDGWYDADNTQITADYSTDEITTIDAYARFVEAWTVTFYNRDAQVYQTVLVDKGTSIGDQLPAVIARDDYDAYWAIGAIVQGGQGNEIRVTGDRIDASFTPAEDTIIVPDYAGIVYTIRFYDEDKEAVVTTKTVTASSSYCLNDVPAVPDKTDCSGKWVYSGGDFSNQVNAKTAGDAATRTLDVWAEYEQNVFTVTYIYYTIENGEEVLNTHKTDRYNKGKNLVLPSDPVVEGKDFIGWYVGETEYTGGEAVNSDLTLIAEFTDQFYVRFVVLNDDGTVKETLSQYFRSAGEAIGQMPQDPFVSGKVFEKWVKEGTDTEVTAETVVEASFVAVAVFRAIDIYKITAQYYYLNDSGTEVVWNTDLLQVEAHELPYTITAPSTTQTDPNEVAGAPIYYPETPTVEVKSTDFDSNKECTVRIKYVPYTAEYDFVYKLKDLTGDDYTEIPDSREHVYGVLNSYVTPTVKTFDYAVLELAEGANITQAEGQELVVKYTRKNYQLTYESNGGSYVGGVTVPYGTEQAVTSTVPTRNGYTFAGWFTDEALTQAAGSTVTVNGNTTLYAKWTGDTVPYTIVYMFEKYNDTGTASSYVYDNSRDATGTVGTTVQASSAPTITRTGWEADTTKNASSSVVIAADGSSVLYVYYKLRTYTLTFNRNSRGWIIKPDGSTTTSTYSIDVKLGQDISGLWPSAGANNRYFTGWYMNGTSGGAFATKQLIMNTELLPNSGTSRTFYARWSTSSSTRTINYWLQNADDNGYTKSDTYSQTVYSSNTFTPKEIAGYTYDHSQNSSNTYNFYYNRDTFKIDYFNGSTNLKTIENVKFDATITSNTYNWTPTAAQCGVDSDYTFAGWYSDSGLTTTYTFNKMPASNLVLYAKWTAPSYTVTFVDGEDTATIYDTKTVEKYKKVSAPETTPSKAGYVFDGWYTTADGNTLYDWNNQITADTTIYAHWTRATLSYTVHYVDDTDAHNPVAADKIVTNPNFVVDQVVTEQAIAVAGYRPQKNSETMTLTAVDSDNVITFVYSAKADTTSYTVKYILDPNEYPGNIEVASPKTVSNVPGDTASVIELAAAIDYEAFYAEHTNLNGIEFYPDEVEKTLVLTANAEQNVLTFVYSSFKNATVTVNFLDMAGNPIADPDVQHLKVGKTFTLSRTPIAGWELNKAVAGAEYSGETAGTTYKITEATTANGLTFTLYYQKKITITAASASKQYDGDALTLSVNLADQVIYNPDDLMTGHSLVGIEFDYANTDNPNNNGRINAGIATVTPKNAEFSGVPNTNATGQPYYTVQYVSGTLEVTKINVTIRIEPDRWTGNIYDGTEKKTGFTNPSKGIADYVIISHEGYAAEYLDDVWEAVKSKATYDASAVGLGYVGIAESDAGDYEYFENAVTLADLPNDPNYSVSIYIRPGLLEIKPAPVTITTGSDTKVYDGTALTKDEASISGLVQADEGKVTVTATGSQLPVGNSDNTYSIDWGTVNSNNYNITENLGVLTVTGGQLTVTVKDIEKTYNGSEQEGRPFVASVTGTGATITTDDYTIEGLAIGDVLTIIYTPAKGKDVGTYENGYFAASYDIKHDGEDTSGNYLSAVFNPGKLTITKATMTVEAVDYSGKYDGETHEGGGSVGSDVIGTTSYTYSTDGGETWTDEVPSITNVGTVTYKVKATNPNYSDATADGTLTVTQRTVTVSVEDKTVTYNGSEQSGNTEYTFENVVNGQTATITYTPSKGTLAATYDNGSYVADTFKVVDVEGTDVTANYALGTQTAGKLTITQASVAITITAASQAWTYDGSAHANTEVTVTSGELLTGDTLVAEATGSVTNVADTANGNNPIAAGYKIMHGNEDVTANYAITAVAGTLTINPKAVTVTAKSEAFTYDGSAHSNSGYDVDGLVGDDAITATVTGSITFPSESPVANVVASYEFTTGTPGNYSVTTADGQLTMTKATVAITITAASQAWTYDGSAHENTEVTVTSGELLTGDELVAEATGSVTNVADTAEGNNPIAAGYKIMHGDEDVTENYAITPVAGTLTIKPINVTVTITGHNNTAAYDGDEHTVTGYDVEISNSLYTANDFTFSGTATATRTNVVEGEDADGQTDMGLAAAQFANNNTNFGTVTFNVTDGYQKITPAALTVTITGKNDSKTYTGSEQSVTGYDISIPAGATLTVAEISGPDQDAAIAKGTDVDGGSNADKTYPMGLTVDQFSTTNTNYTVTFDVTDGWLKITTAELTVTITGNNNTLVYNGSEQSVTGYTISIPEGATLTVAEINGPAQEEAIAKGANVDGGSNEDGTYPMGLKPGDFGTDNENYTVTFEVTDGWLKITPKEVTAKVNDATKVYNGERQEGETVVQFAGIIEGETASITYNPAAGINFGNYTGSFGDESGTGFRVIKQDGSDSTGNYTLKTLTAGKLEITAKKVTITANNAGKTYNGSALTESGFTASALEEGDTHTFTVTMTADSTITNVGTQPNVIATVDGEAVETGAEKKIGNYLVTTVDGTLTINPKAVTITAKDASKAYDGEPLTEAGFTATDLEEGDTHTFTVVMTAESTITNEGTQPNVIATVDGESVETGVEKQIGNYLVTTANGTLEITKDTKAIVITSATTAWTYDSKLHKDETYTVTYGGEAVTAGEDGKTFTLENGDVITITATAEGVKDYSESYNENNTFTYTVKKDSADTSGNYASITATYGTLSIDKRTVTLTSASGEKPYDGTPLTKPEVTVGGDGFVEGEVSDIKATGSVTTVAEGEVTNTIVYTEGAAFKADNYTISKNEGKLKITQDQTALTIESSTKSWTYDGQTHTDEVYTVTYDGTKVEADSTGKVFTLPTGDTVTITATAAGVKDYDASYSKNNTYDYEISNAGSYSNVTANVGTLSITKAPLTITADSASKEYDGTPLTDNGWEDTAPVGLQGDDKVISVVVTGTITNVGTADNVARAAVVRNGDLDVTNNYEIEYVNGTLEITQSTKALEITSSTKSWEYDGELHKDEVYTVTYDGAEVTADSTGKVFTLPTGDTVTITATAAGVKYVADTAEKNNTYDYVLTNASQYSNVTANYGTLSITKAPLTITADSASKEYDGKPLTDNGWEDTAPVGLKGTDAVESVTVTGTITEVGTEKNVASAAVVKNGETDVTANYEIEYVDGKLEVTKSTKELKVESADGEWTYDASAHTNKTYTVKFGDETINGTEGQVEFTLSTGDTLTITPAATATITHVTETTVDNAFTWTVENESFYTKGTDKVGKLSITPATLTITADSNSKVYDGEALTDDGWQDTAPVGLKGTDEVDSVTVTGTQTLVGTSDNTASSAVVKNGENDVTADYKITYFKGTLTITDDGVDPSLVVNKAADIGPYALGAEVTFQITATNIYAEAKTITLEEIEGVTLAEDTFENVPAGETVETTATYTITEKDILNGSFENTVTAKIETLVKTAEAKVNTEKKNGHLTVTKTTTSETPEGGYPLGATITYKITVTNDGNLTIENIKVTDELTGDEWTIASLAPDASETFTAEYVVTEADILAGEVLNVATATGTSPDPDKPDVPVDPGEDPEPTEDKNGHIAIEKVTTSEPENGESYALGETITYEITVTNDGNLTITDITVEDELTGDEWTIESLAPGANETFTAEYVVTEEDAKAGEVVNVATAKGTSPDPDKPDVPVDPGEDPEPVEEPDDKIERTITYKDSADGKVFADVVYKAYDGDPTPAFGPEPPARLGYTFMGWSPKVAKTVNGDATYWAMWRPNIPIHPPVTPVEPSPALNYDDHVAYIIGYPDGNFYPNKNVTRAETATMIFRLLTEARQKEIYTTVNGFSDVDASKWYNEYVSSMANGGYVEGYPDGTFGGDKMITRAEFVTILVRFFGLTDADCIFSDVSTSHWAYRYIATATAYGWLLGYEDGTFRPDQAITRAEAVTVINRMLNRGVNETSNIGDAKTFPDTMDPKKWYYYEIIEAANYHEYTGHRPNEQWYSVGGKMEQAG